MTVKRYAILVVLTYVLGTGSTALRAGTSDELSAEAIDRRIRQHRVGELVVMAKPGAEVRVEQVRHEFWFGAALSPRAFGGGLSAEDHRRYRQTFVANFNAAVTEGGVKWHDMEPQRGEVNYRIVEAMLAWTQEHEIPLRGHCLFWGVPTWVQDWVKQLNDDDLRTALKTRATTFAGRYRGRFAEYDLNNEMLHGNYYEDRLGPGITRDMASWVRQGDPNVVLFLNENILTDWHLDAYIVQIRRFLDQGVPFGGIGVQGHDFGDSFDPAALQNALARLSEFKLPIRVTEFNFPGMRSKYYGQRGARLSDEEEQVKAKALVDHYRICFAQPAVTGIMMWGFWEGANWIPVSSLYRRDWTPTPAAEAYRELVFKQWWTQWEGKADANGQCHIPAFYGKYAITCGTQTKQVLLSKRNGRAAISFE